MLYSRKPLTEEKFSKFGESRVIHQTNFSCDGLNNSCVLALAPANLFLQISMNYCLSMGEHEEW